jgi:hypothetical protein
VSYTSLSLQRYPVLLTALMFSLPDAEAAGFQVKTMRAPMSASEVERSVLIGRGWLEFDLGADIKNTTGYWDEQGQKQEFDAANWLYTTQRIGVRYGVTRRSEFFWLFPFHYVRLSNEKLGTDTSDFGLGDLHVGYRYEWFRRDAPLTSIVTDFELRLPSGSEAPASFVGGPNTVSEIVLSTGQPDLTLALKGKQQLGPISLMASIGYVRRFSAVTQFTIEVDQYQFLGRFKPGDEIQAHFAPTVQLGPIALAAEGVYGRRLLSKMGTTAAGLLPDNDLDVIQGTDGDYMDLTPSATIHLTRGFDISGGATIPLMGEDLSFWPLEEISPTRGITYSATVELRY